MGLLHVKGETDTPIYIQQSRDSWDKGLVFGGSAKAEASEFALFYSVQGHLWEHLDLAADFLSLKKVGLSPDLSFKKRKKLSASLTARKPARLPQLQRSELWEARRASWSL